MSDEELDRILNAALERYSDVEPLDGLSERILCRVAGESRLRLRGWLMAGALATAVLAGIVALHLNPRPDVERLVAHPRPVIAHRQETPIVVRPARRIRRHVERTKQLVFPMPTPMTAEEKSLADLASARPGVFPDIEKDPEPILVVPLEVTPVVTELMSNPN